MTAIENLVRMWRMDEDEEMLDVMMVRCDAGGNKVLRGPGR